MLNKDGYPSLEQVKSNFPEKSVIVKPKAIIEYYEKIPCNPCETSCPFKAITIGPTSMRFPGSIMIFAPAVASVFIVAPD